MKTTIKFTILFIISIALFNCSSDTNSTTQEEEEEESNAIPQVNTIVSSFAGPSINGFTWYFYLNGCGGIDIDSDDNLYIAIAHGSRVVKITPQQEILNFAGVMEDDEGVYGNLDGTGAQAKFGRPIGVAVNSLGEVFISDYGNNNIRKIV